MMNQKPNAGTWGLQWLCYELSTKLFQAQTVDESARVGVVVIDFDCS
jgi:hypothetical protein